MPSKWISKKQRLAIYTRDAMVCCYCGKQCQQYNVKPTPDTITLDHIVSQKELAAASADDREFSRKQKDAKNLVVVCNACNSSKQELSLYVWCSQKNKDYSRIIIEIGVRTCSI